MNYELVKNQILFTTILLFIGFIVIGGTTVVKNINSERVSELFAYAIGDHYTYTATAHRSVLPSPEITSLSKTHAKSAETMTTSPVTPTVDEKNNSMIEVPLEEPAITDDSFTITEDKKDLVVEQVQVQTEPTKDKYESVRGTHTTNGKELILRANDSSTSLHIVRDTHFLKNYSVKVTFDFNLGRSFGVIVRYKDQNNYTYCSVRENASYITLFTVVNGEVTRLAGSPELPQKQFEPWRDLHVNVTVAGNTILCGLDNKTIISYNLNEIERDGSVGFKAHTLTNESLIQIKEVKIEEI